MNLDEYIIKFEKGAFGFQELQKFAKNRSISTIFRLYASYGVAKKVRFYDRDSLKWILSYLEKMLKLSGLEEAASLLKIDINDSFSDFWTRFEELNGVILPKKATT
ncbi:MAG: hypothetical protein QNJ72_17065 [Pleurocapsa sp. MO_226.B13]|nr:hypothetical protein [Pleurocapsa sp. MO_226.B13]